MRRASIKRRCGAATRRAERARQRRRFHPRSRAQHLTRQALCAQNPSQQRKRAHVAGRASGSRLQLEPDLQQVDWHNDGSLHHSCSAPRPIDRGERQQRLAAAVDSAARAGQGAACCSVGVKDHRILQRAGGQRIRHASQQRARALRPQNATQESGDAAASARLLLPNSDQIQRLAGGHAACAADSTCLGAVLRE